MRRNLPLLILLLAIALAGIGIWYLASRESSDGSTDAAVGTAAQKSYSSARYGIAFSYPGAYVLTERDIEVGSTTLHAIVMLPAGAAPPQDGEGPPGVAVIIGDNASGMPLADWLNRLQITGESFDFSETTLAGERAVSYTSTGLYESDNIAAADGGRVYVISASWMTREDATLSALATIAESFRFIN